MLKSFTTAHQYKVLFGIPSFCTNARALSCPSQTSHSLSCLKMQSQRKNLPVCRKQMDGIRDVMNAAVSGEGGSSKRIAGEVGREYILQKDAPLPKEAPEKKESGRFGRFGSAHSSEGLGKPPLAPTMSRKVHNTTYPTLQCHVTETGI